MATKHATRKQTVENASCSSKPTRTSNLKPNTLSDQHDVLSETYNVWAEVFKCSNTLQIISFATTVINYLSINLVITATYCISLKN